VCLAIKYHMCLHNPPPPVRSAKFSGWASFFIVAPRAAYRLTGASSFFPRVRRPNSLNINHSDYCKPLICVSVVPPSLRVFLLPTKIFTPSSFFFPAGLSCSSPIDKQQKFRKWVFFMYTLSDRVLQWPLRAQAVQRYSAGVGLARRAADAS